MGNARCAQAVANYRETTLADFELVYQQYLANDSTLAVGFSALMMAKSRDGFSFLAGPVAVCGT